MAFILNMKVIILNKNQIQDYPNLKQEISVIKDNHFQKQQHIQIIVR